MSTSATTAPLPSHRPEPAREERTALRLVVPPIARRKIPTPFLCLMLLVAGLVAILIANIYISHSTFRVEQLSGANHRLSDERDRLGEDIAYRSSPQNVERAARAQGLKHASSVNYLFLSTGRITKESGGGTADSQHVHVPGPRADTREDVSPNLRSNRKQSAVGTDSGRLNAPHVRSPKPQE